MSRIKQAFNKKKALIGFLTGGDPSVDKTIDYICEMERAGVDLIEIGIPFSDPVAEGIVIEKANERALKAGTTTDSLFEMVKKIRKKTQIPLVFLTYMNPIFVYGADRFFKKCQETGIDGVIIPDLPYEEREEVLGLANIYGIDRITLIAPTSHDRIIKLAQPAHGFIYLVSSMGVTGVRKEINTDLASIIEQIKKVSTVPVAVGFGISTPDQVKEIGEISDGVIIGSAIVRIIEEYGEHADSHLYDYIKTLKASLDELTENELE
ncbi:tryptophan synthase subunit alpha [Eubacteriaceae bacterium ES2]|nr:tryptophan synthase subunit alpha [Eubacteriaceae bacterium ES2]